MIQKKSLPLAWVAVAAATIAVTSCATTGQDWRKANTLGSIEAYEQFLEEHPNARQADDAKKILYELAWGKAEAANSIKKYEEFLAKNPDGEKTEIAQRRLRELRYSYAKNEMTVSAIESFIGQYSEGKDVEALKAELPAARELEKSLALGRAIMKYASTTSLHITDFSVTGMTSTKLSPSPRALAGLEAMLQDGADPNAVCVLGYVQAGSKQLASGVVLHSSGEPGRIVPARKGGITLLEYCLTENLASIASLLTEYGAKQN